MKCQAMHRSRGNGSLPSEWPRPRLKREVDHMTDNQAYSFLSLITYSDGRVQWNAVALLELPSEDLLPEPAQCFQFLTDGGTRKD